MRFTIISCLAPPPPFCSPEFHNSCNNNDVRLVGGVVAWEGAVEVCQNDEWLSICDEAWDARDAQVICKQLGYSTEGQISCNKNDLSFMTVD